MEIERKFLIDKTFFKNIKKNDLSSYTITQYYVKTDDTEKRFRMKDDSCFCTIKSPIVDNLIRDEYEKECSLEEFKANFKNKIGNVITKTRYKLRWNKNNFEIDEYSGSLEGLVVCEIEFKTFQDAMDFIIPSFCIKEVTFDERYKNQNLALYGLPNSKDKHF